LYAGVGHMRGFIQEMEREEDEDEDEECWIGSEVGGVKTCKDCKAFKGISILKIIIPVTIRFQSIFHTEIYQNNILF